MSLPKRILEKAFVMGNEYAWQKQDLPGVFEYLIEARVAIIACEAWIVRHINDAKENEPSDWSHHSDPDKRQKGLILSRWGDYVVYGVIPDKTGNWVVYGWDTKPRLDSQTWDEYVHSTVQTSKKALEEVNFETEVIPEYSPFVFYNLVLNFEEETNS